MAATGLAGIVVTGFGMGFGLYRYGTASVRGRILLAMRCEKPLAIGQKLWHNQPLGQSKARFDFAQWCEEGLPSG
ncbi:MAG: hypothetical protein ACK5WY_07440 [Holosporaceae bacterium]|nr:hypothetical protein [Rhodospirillaceae bacterium]